MDNWQAQWGNTGSQADGSRTDRWIPLPRSTCNAWNTWRPWRRVRSPTLHSPGPSRAGSNFRPPARAQLASSPYLLADAGFDDESRWMLLAQRMVQDLPPVQVEPVFVGPGAGDFIRRVLMFAWHLARANRQLARVVLGMSPGSAVRIAALRLQDLDWLAQHRPAGSVRVGKNSHACGGTCSLPRGTRIASS